MHQYLPLSLKLAGLALLIGSSLQASAATPTLTIDQLRQQREKIKQQPRRIWFNHDGCDAWYFDTNSLKGRVQATPKDLLNVRTTQLADKQVDTLSYCTICSGFGNFTHRTKIGHVLADPKRVVFDEPTANIRNITEDLIAQGTDPLQVMVDFCKAKNIEIFWSMRMNDTHDQGWTPEKGYPLFPKLKEQHPEWLLGSYSNQTAYGPWSGVNYARPEIRDYCYRFFEEVCQNYNVDGVEMDFLRHLQYFPSVSNGGQASDKDREMMTDLMRRIRTMTEREGLKRGRPILIAVRAPDSAEYSRNLGLDIEQWMKEGLIDCFIGSDYFQLNQYGYQVDLAHKYVVKCYPGLSETRVSIPGKKGPDGQRGSDASYKARAMNAFAQGGDGVYIFNEYSATKSYLYSIGSPTSLLGQDKMFFVTWVNGKPSTYLAGGNSYQRSDILTPADPVILTAGKRVERGLYVGEDLRAAIAAGLTPALDLELQITKLGTADNAQVEWNGKLLKGEELKDNQLHFKLTADQVIQGLNRVGLTELQAMAPKTSLDWTVNYSCAYQLAGTNQPPWRRLFSNGNWEEKIVDGALLFADRGTKATDTINLVYPWTPRTDVPCTVEVRVKVLQSTDPMAVVVRLADGEHVEFLTFATNSIGLAKAGLSAAYNTTDAFHTYRIETKDKDLKVYADEKLLLDGTGRFTASATDPANATPMTYGLEDWNHCSLMIGSNSGPGQGTALWGGIRFRITGKASWEDLLLKVSYPQASAKR
ncbi:MAG: family 10 glycosylhydrolase [Kiritimatiellaeota bacterium]|nr:family 10 glycosylhydrolase [Kiritimatiellota bacterium]